MAAKKRNSGNLSAATRPHDRPSRRSRRRHPGVSSGSTALEPTGPASAPLGYSLNGFGLSPSRGCLPEPQTRLILLPSGAGRVLPRDLRRCEPRSQAALLVVSGAVVITVYRETVGRRRGLHGLIPGARARGGLIRVPRRGTTRPAKGSFRSEGAVGDAVVPHPRSAHPLASARRHRLVEPERAGWHPGDDVRRPKLDLVRCGDVAGDVDDFIASVDEAVSGLVDRSLAARVVRVDHPYRTALDGDEHGAPGGCASRSSRLRRARSAA